MHMTLSRKQVQIAEGESAPVEFEALFQEHWERLCRVLFRMLGDRAEAEDLALESFVQLYRRPPGQNDNLGGWLYRVATNLGLNSLRARKRRQQYEEQAGELQIDQSESNNPAEIVEKAFESRRVRNALSAMKPRSAQILILRYSGLSYAEIAQATGMRASSIGKSLARAEKEFEQQYRRL